MVYYCRYGDMFHQICQQKQIEWCQLELYLKSWTLLHFSFQAKKQKSHISNALSLNGGRVESMSTTGTPLCIKIKNSRNNNIGETRKIIIFNVISIFISQVFEKVINIACFNEKSLDLLSYVVKPLSHNILSIPNMHFKTN